jgi:hypothetical protein
MRDGLTPLERLPVVRHAWMRGVDQALGTNRTPPPPPSTWPQMRVSEMGAICEDHLDLVVREGGVSLTMLFHNHPRLFLYDTLSCLVLPYDISLQETLGAEGIMMEATAPPPPPPPPSHGNSTIPITALHGSFIANQCPSCSYECMAAGPSALSSPYLSLSHRFHAFGYPQPWAWARALRCTDGRVASSAFLPVAARVRLCVGV